MIDCELLLVDPREVPVEEVVPGEPVPVRADLAVSGTHLGVVTGHLPATRRWERADQDLLELLNFALEFESKAVKLYTETLALAAGDRALEVFLENILEEEQDGVDELTRILRDPKAVSASLGASKVG